MSNIQQCDCVDCYNTSMETTIYYIDYETEEYLRENLSNYFNGYADICEECVKNINNDYPELLVVGDYCVTIETKIEE